MTNVDLTKMVCPQCGSTKLSFQSNSIIAKGEAVGIVYDDAKAGCYDWQHIEVGIAFDSNHMFWIEKK